MAWSMEKNGYVLSANSKGEGFQVCKVGADKALFSSIEYDAAKRKLDELSAS